LAGLSVVPIPCRGQARSRSGRFTRWLTSNDEFLGSLNASLVVDHFTLTVIANFAVMAISHTPSCNIYAPLPPLASMLPTGLYMFVLP